MEGNTCVSMPTDFADAAIAPRPGAADDSLGIAPSPVCGTHPGKAEVCTSLSKYEDDCPHSSNHPLNSRTEWSVIKRSRGPFGNGVLVIAVKEFDGPTLCLSEDFIGCVGESLAPENLTTFPTRVCSLHARSAVSAERRVSNHDHADQPHQQFNGPRWKCRVRGE